MPRRRAATAETPASTDTDAAIDPAVDPDLSDAATDPAADIEPSGDDSAGLEGAPPSGDGADPRDPEGWQTELRRAREGQAAEARKAANAQRELNRLRGEQLLREREAEDRRLEDLAETDPDAYIEETRSQRRANRERSTAFQQHETQVVTFAKQARTALFPELDDQAFADADAEMEQIALQRFGRPANAAEKLAMYGDYRVRVIEDQLTAKDAEITQLKAKVAALQGNRASDVIDDDDEGPERVPADGRRPTGKLTLASWQAMTPAQRAKVPLEDETRMIREEMRRRSGAAQRG